MTYFKIFAISVCSSLLFLSVFVMVAFDSENTLSKAYDHYANKEYYEARQLLINEDNSIPLADFYLYEAYLAREELGLKKSQGYLYQAIQELATKKSSTALEIALNLALDAYLQKDIDALEIAIEQSRVYAAAEDPWIQFFIGCQAYLNRDYILALKSWEACQSRHCLSNWMKTSFENHLTDEQIELNRLHAEIETGQLWTTRKKLEQSLLTLPDYQDDIHFLLALSYIKEGDKLPFDQRHFAYQKSIELLQKVPENNLYYIQEKHLIHEAIKDQILQEISQSHFVTLSLYIAMMEKWHAQEYLEKISAALAGMFNEKVMTGHHTEASNFIWSLSESMPDGELKRLFTLKLSKQLDGSIAKGNLRHLEDYWKIYQNIPWLEKQTFLLLAEATSCKILEFVESDHSNFEKTKTYIQLWKSFEKNPSNRYFLAQELLQKAYRFWAVNGESQKAITLIKIAESLPFVTEQQLIHADIQRTVVKIYRQAILQDHVHEFPFIQTAAKEFQLSDVEFFDRMETSNQLADAQYLFHIGRYPLASSKALWVLQMDPNDQLARKIAAMTAYEEGHYSEVIDHIKYLKAIDNSINEALAVSKILTGDIHQSQLLLNALAEKHSLSDETILRLGFGFLILSQPDQSMFWLNKISTVNDEVRMGLCIAAFQKQSWDVVVSQYNQLSNMYKQNPVVQGIVIQALVAQNQIEKANEIFSTFLLTQSHHSIHEAGSKAFILIQKHLSHFDANDFAARYFLHVKKDPELALRKFREIKHSTPELLLERADLAYSLKNYAESIQDLQRLLQNSNGSIREKALIKLGDIYLELGFYPDSVRHFKELFTLNSLQSTTIHQSYCKALRAIGRVDLAIKHYSLLGIIPPAPLVAPQEFGMVLDPNISPEKRLKIFEFQQTLYPECISLQMLRVKELIHLSEKKENASEELLSAYDILEIINKEHPYIPESWFLQGQVLAKLHFKESAKQTFAKAISLNPHYAEAYKQLAAINVSECDYLAATYNLKQVLQITPHDTDTWNSLAHLYETQNQLEEAVRKECL